jgi:hypothetical protein
VNEKDASADSLSKHVTVKAPGEKALHAALGALGVVKPEDVKVDYTIGEGETVKQVSATFWLTDVVE